MNFHSWAKASAADQHRACSSSLSAPQETCTPFKTALMQPWCIYMHICRHATVCTVSLYLWHVRLQRSGTYSISDTTSVACRFVSYYTLYHINNSVINLYDSAMEDKLDQAVKWQNACTTHGWPAAGRDRSIIEPTWCLHWPRHSKHHRWRGQGGGGLNYYQSINQNILMLHVC